MRDFGVPERFASTFAKAANAANARNTWKQRRSVLRTIEACRQDTANLLEFPWGDKDLQIYVGWSIEEGKKSSTIIQYISNVNSLHKEMGLHMTIVNRYLINQVVKGHGNLAEPTPGRIPMTPDLMFHLKYKLSKSKLPLPERRLMWVIATALFQGSFRIGELLSPTRSRFCPDTTLLSSNVKWETAYVSNKMVDLLKFRIKNPKESRGRKHVDVEIFDLGPNCFYDCVTAFRKWRDSSTLPCNPDLPLFRNEDGSLVTPDGFNSVLKELMCDKVQYMEGFVASHSFRSGLASVMAQLGYSDSDIKLQGRWGSDAFKSYVRLGRSARLEEQWALANRITSLILPGGHLARQ